MVNMVKPPSFMVKPNHFRQFHGPKSLGQDASEWSDLRLSLPCLLGDGCAGQRSLADWEWCGCPPAMVRNGCGPCFLSHGGTPIAGWFTIENPIDNGWFGGTTILTDLHIAIWCIMAMYHVEKNMWSVIEQRFHVICHRFRSVLSSEVFHLKWHHVHPSSLLKLSKCLQASQIHGKHPLLD